MGKKKSKLAPRWGWSWFTYLVLAIPSGLVGLVSTTVGIQLNNDRIRYTGIGGVLLFLVVNLCAWFLRSSNPKGPKRGLSFSIPILWKNKIHAPVAVANDGPVQQAHVVKKGKQR